MRRMKIGIFSREYLFSCYQYGDIPVSESMELNFSTVLPVEFVTAADTGFTMDFIRDFIPVHGFHVAFE